MLSPARQDRTPSSPTAASALWLLDLGAALLTAALLYVSPRTGPWPLGCLTVGWLVRWCMTGRLSRVTPLDLPLAVFVLSGLISAILAFNQRPEWGRGAEWSAYFNPLHWAWGKFYFIVAAVGLYYALANLGPSRLLWWLLRLYPAFGAMVGLYFILTNDWDRRSEKSALLGQLGSWLTAPLPDLPLHQLMPNVAGGIVAWTMPFLVPALAGARGRRRLLWLAVGLLGLFGLLLSGSRGAWLALLTVGIGWLASLNLHETVGKWRRVSGRRPALALLALLLVVMLVGVLAESSLGRSLDIVQSGTVASRVELLQSSWLLAQDYLYTGGGLGAFPMLYSSYYLLIPVLFLPHSHNLLLDLLIEQGLVGLLSYVWLIVGFVLVCRAGLQASANGQATGDLPADAARRGLAASLASLAVMLLHGLVDDVPYGSRALLLMFVPLGFGVALAPPLVRQQPARGLFRPALIGLGVVLVAVFWLRGPLLGSWQANLGALEQARRELSGYRWPEQTPQEFRTAGDLGASVDQLQRALNFDSGQRTAHQRLGMIELARGSPGAAREHLLAVVRADPDNPAAWRLLAESYLALGEQEQTCQIEARAQAEQWGAAWRFAVQLCR